LPHSASTSSWIVQIIGQRNSLDTYRSPRDRRRIVQTARTSPCFHERGLLVPLWL